MCDNLFQIEVFINYKYYVMSCTWILQPLSSTVNLADRSGVSRLYINQQIRLHPSVNHTTDSLTHISLTTTPTPSDSLSWHWGMLRLHVPSPRHVMLGPPTSVYPRSQLKVTTVPGRFRCVEMWVYEGWEMREGQMTVCCACVWGNCRSVCMCD